MSEATVVIEKGVPMPTGRKRTSGMYPWAAMEIGDSFVAQQRGNYNSVNTAAHRAGKELGRKFICRKVPEGIRVWRAE